MSSNEAGNVAGEVYVTYSCPLLRKEILRNLYVISPSNFSEQSPKKNCKFYLWREKKPLSGPTFSHRSYCLNHFCHFSKAYRNLYLFNKMLIYASGKRSMECAYMLRWLLFHFWILILHQPEKWNKFPPKKTSNTQQRERKRSLFIMLLQSPLSDVLWLQLF